MNFINLIIPSAVWVNLDLVEVVRFSPHTNHECELFMIGTPDNSPPYVTDDPIVANEIYRIINNISKGEWEQQKNAGKESK